MGRKESIFWNSLAGEQVMVEKWDNGPAFGGTALTGWTFTKLSSNQFQFGGAAAGTYTSVDMTPPGIGTGMWHHIAVTRSSGLVTVYWDGASIATLIVANIDSTPQSLKLGRRSDSRGFFHDGLIDEVEIYNRALSTTEIQAIFLAGSKGKCKVATVSIDIKPGSFPNSINPKSKGVIPVAILTTDTFDATTVDPTTVRFGPTGTEAAPVQSALEDVDGDGDTDIILHFKTQDTGIVCGAISASLTGETFGGQAIEGSDSIKTVGCK